MSSLNNSLINPIHKRNLSILYDKYYNLTDNYVNSNIIIIIVIIVLIILGFILWWRYKNRLKPEEKQLAALQFIKELSIKTGIEIPSNKNTELNPINSSTDTITDLNNNNQKIADEIIENVPGVKIQNLHQPGEFINEFNILLEETPGETTEPAYLDFDVKKNYVLPMMPAKRELPKPVETCVRIPVEPVNLTPGPLLPQPTKAHGQPRSNNKIMNEKIGGMGGEKPIGGGSGRGRRKKVVEL